MTTFIILLIIALTIICIISYLSLWLGARIFGIKATAKSILLPAAVVTVAGLAAQLIPRIIDQPVISALASVVLFGIVLYLWHILLRRRHAATFLKSAGSYIVGSIIGGVLAAILAMIAITFVQSYEIAGNAMSPTLNNKDRVLVFKSGQNYKKGDVVVFDYKMVYRMGQTPDNPDIGRTYGRILGLPGDTVTPSRTYFLPNGLSYESAVYTLKSGEYYVAADNAAVAPGYIVTADSIIGKVGPTIKKAE